LLNDRANKHIVLLLSKRLVKKIGDPSNPTIILYTNVHPLFQMWTIARSLVFFKLIVISELHVSEQDLIPVGKIRILLSQQTSATKHSTS
jgi:hypothetical protein